MTADLKVALGALGAALLFTSGVMVAAEQLRYASDLSVTPVTLGGPTHAPFAVPPSNTSRMKSRPGLLPDGTTPSPPVPSVSAPAPSPTPPSDSSAAVRDTLPTPTVPVSRDVYTSNTEDYRGDDDGDHQERDEQER